MAELMFSVPAKVIFGQDVLNRLGTVVAEWGDRAMLVSESVLTELGVTQKIQDILEKRQIQIILFDEISNQSDSRTAEDGIRIAKASRAQVVIGVGGVKTLSFARAIAATVKSDALLDDHLSGKAYENPALPYIEVPTTNRNPFMFRDEYLLTDGRNRNAVVRHVQRGLCNVVIMDPVLSGTLSIRYVMTNLMDTLLSILEGFISRKSNFLSDTVFIEALSVIFALLNQPQTKWDNLDVKEKLARAGFLAAMGLSMCQQGLGGALAYMIASKHSLPKSWIATVLLPHVLEFFRNASVDKFAIVARIMEGDQNGGREGAAADRIADRIRQILGAQRLPLRLREFNLKLDDMPDVADLVSSMEMINAIPTPASTEDIYELLKTAF